MKKYIYIYVFLTFLIGFGQLHARGNDSPSYLNPSGTSFESNSMTGNPTGLGIYDCNQMFSPNSQATNIMFTQHYQSGCGAIMMNPMTGWYWSQMFESMFHNTATTTFDFFNNPKKNDAGYIISRKPVPSKPATNDKKNKKKKKKKKKETDPKTKAECTEKEIQVFALAVAQASAAGGETIIAQATAAVVARGEGNDEQNTVVVKAIAQAYISNDVKPGKATRQAKAMVKKIVKNKKCSPVVPKYKSPQSPAPITVNPITPAPIPGNTGPITDTKPDTKPDKPPVVVAPAPYSSPCTVEQQKIAVTAIAKAIATNDDNSNRTAEKIKIRAESYAKTVVNGKAFKTPIEAAAKAIAETQTVGGKSVSFAQAEVVIDQLRSGENCDPVFAPKETEGGITCPGDPECNTPPESPIQNVAKGQWCEETYKKEVKPNNKISSDTKKCIESSIDNYGSLKTTYAICSKNGRNPADTGEQYNCYAHGDENSKKNYVNTILNSYGDMVSCLGLNQKEFIPVLNQESRHHINVLNDPKDKNMYPSAGIGQLAIGCPGCSLTDISKKRNNSGSKWVGFENAVKKINGDSSCSKYKPYLKNVKTTDSICEFIDPARNNPDKALIISALAHEIMKDYMLNYLKGDQNFPKKPEYALGACELQGVPFTDDQRKQLALKLAGHAYNHSPNRAALDLCLYLKRPDVGVIGDDGKPTGKAPNMNNFELNGKKAGAFWVTNSNKKGATIPDTSTPHTHMTQLQENLQLIEEKSKNKCHAYE